MVENLPSRQETRVWSLSQKYPLEKGMATHSHILTEEFHGSRSPVGYSPRGHKELEMAEHTYTQAHIVDL